MKLHRTKVSMEDLSAYMDGETSAEAAERILTALAKDYELMKIYKDYRRQTAALYRMNRSIMDEDIPDRLLELIRCDEVTGDDG